MIIWREIENIIKVRKVITEKYTYKSVEEISQRLKQNKKKKERKKREIITKLEDNLGPGTFQQQHWNQ